MNPLECLESKREEILNEYKRILKVYHGSRRSKSEVYKFGVGKKDDLKKIKELIDCYELTICTLKAMNNYEYLDELN